MEDTLVLYPALGMAHMISMLELAKLILRRYSHRFSTIHILVTTGLLNIKSTYLDYISNTNPSIIFHHFPLTQVDFTPTRSFSAIAFDFIRLNVPNARHALQEISNTVSIRAFVIDFFCTSVLTYANDIGIPTYYFLTSELAALAVYLHFPTIHKQIRQSFKGLVGTELRVPGLPPFPAAHMPQPILDINDPAYHDILYFSEHLSKSSGILVKTYDELEPIPLKAITDGFCIPCGPTPPIYNIGPLMLLVSFALCVSLEIV